jgi:hypothetical protein
MVDSLRVMAQWYNPCMGPKDLKKRFGVQTHWCASKKPCQSFAIKLDLGVPTSCQVGYVVVFN